jgi:hypothetical protein
MEKLIAPVFNSVPEALDNLTTVTGIAANNIIQDVIHPFITTPCIFLSFQTRQYQWSQLRNQFLNRALVNYKFEDIYK